MTEGHISLILILLEEQNTDYGVVCVLCVGKMALLGPKSILIFKRIRSRGGMVQKKS